MRKPFSTAPSYRNGGSAGHIQYSRRLSGINAGGSGRGIAAVHFTAGTNGVRDAAEIFRPLQWSGTLATSPLGGGAPREMLENVFDADWSPDGNELAVIDRGISKLSGVCNIPSERCCSKAKAG